MHSDKISGNIWQILWPSYYILKQLGLEYVFVFVFVKEEENKGVRVGVVMLISILVLWFDFEQVFAFVFVFVFDQLDDPTYHLYVNIPLTKGRGREGCVSGCGWVLLCWVDLNPGACLWLDLVATLWAVNITGVRSLSYPRPFSPARLPSKCNTSVMKGAAPLRCWRGLLVSTQYTEPLKLHTRNSPEEYQREADYNHH